MKDIRITKLRQIIKHERLCPKVELEKRSGVKENERKKFRRDGKKMERRKIIFLKKENAPISSNCLRQKILIKIMKEDKEMKIKL